MKNKENTLGANKQMAFLNTTKLAVLSAVLLLAVFCTIGMSFTPAEEGENIGNPNDSTYVTGPRRGHWKKEGTCGDTYYNLTDYGKASVTIVGNGEITTIGTNTTHDEATLKDNTLTVTWNTGFGDTENKENKTDELDNLHSNTVTFTATANEGHIFSGWYEDVDCTLKLSDDHEYSRTYTIPGATYADSKDEREKRYENKDKPWDGGTIYAKFIEVTPVDLTFIAPGERGTIKVTIAEENTLVTDTNITKYDIMSEVTLAAEAKDGYIFAGWYTKDSKGQVTEGTLNTSLSKIFAEDCSIGAHFVASTEATFKNITKDIEYYGLRLATKNATSGDVIIPLKEETIVDGADLIPGTDTYTIPSDVTLLIPYDDAYTVEKDNHKYAEAPAVSSRKVSPYRTLTLDSGVKINVDGDIVVGAQYYSSNGTNPGGVCAKYGFIMMNEGSLINLNVSAKLYVWGYISGDGQIIAAGSADGSSGANVYEMFQITDFRGGDATVNKYAVKDSEGKKNKVFPILSYYMQNIEVPLTLEYGANLSVDYGLYMLSQHFTGRNYFIGSNSSAMFNMQKGTIKRRYDRMTDRIHYELNGNCDLKNITIKVNYGLTYTINSNEYILPINSNMTINVKSGSKFNLTQDMSFLPCTDITIEQGATLEVNEGLNVYTYDAKNWVGRGCVMTSFDFEQLLHVGRNDKGTYGKPFERTMEADNPNHDARLKINGEMILNGYLYTSSFGANICSDGGGKIIYKKSAGTQTQIWQGKNTAEFQSIPITAAQLHNDESKTWNQDEKYKYTQTSGAAAGDIFTYSETYGRWRCERTITWDANGGTIEPTTTIVGRGEPLSLYFPESLPIPTREGYTFNGWFTAETDGKKITADTIVNDNMDYYAQWTANKYTITWNPNNGEVEPTNSTYTYDGEYVVLPTPTREGYTFNGWFTAEIGGTQITEIGNTNKPTSNVEYYAQWTANNYTITWYPNNGEDLMYSTYTYDGEPVDLPTPKREGYTFNGWFTAKTGGTQITEIGNTNKPTSNVEYYARWTLNIVGTPLDIVDADNTDNTNKTLTINANGWASTGWPYTINGTSYAKTARKADRTLTVPYTGDTNDDMAIVVTKTGGEIVSSHIYKVPFVYNTSNATLSGTDANSIVFVKSGTLSIEGDASAKEIYVAPGAEIKVTGKLTVGKLVLRTTPWQSAVLTIENGGAIEDGGQVYYSRISPDSKQYYQFGLPLSCALANVKMSNTDKLGGSQPKYGTAWTLKSYSESSRAEKGIREDGANWDLLPSNGTITAGVGYEMFSNSNYYREFYFLVNLSEATTQVSVQYTGGTISAEHNGWNIITSPLTSKATVTIGDPATAIKVCWLQADGSYKQEVPTVIPPAIPFSYQASAGNKELNFSVSSTAAAAPRKQSAAEALTETEWVHLDIFDAYGEGDETSLFVHPTRFEQTYKTGIDVAKQSLTAARPIIYSTHAYGDMAFAGVADSLLENGIDLVVYSPSAQELTFSQRENKFLHRLEYLWLADNETGARTDLLMDDYTCRANAGTVKGRFMLNGRFKAPQISTGIGNTQTDYNIYAIGNNIAISGVEQGAPIYVFDAVGHMIYTTAATSDEVIVPAPCAGVYMLSVGGQTAKLVINK